MLEAERVHPRVFGRARRSVDGSVSFPQRDDRGEVLDEREQLAEAPHAAQVKLRVARPARPERLLERVGPPGSKVVIHVEQPPALRARVEPPRDGVFRETILLYAAEICARSSWVHR